MNKWLRILRHRSLDERDVERRLGPGAIDRLEHAVAASERQHSGEIRLCIEAGLPLDELLAGSSARQRAVALFGQLGVWDTEENNGVLIYLLIAEHAIEIVADRGLSRRVDEAQWQAIATAMAGAFKAGRFEDGLLQAIDAVGQLLDRHFPLAEGEANPDELPNRAVLR